MRQYTAPAETTVTLPGRCKSMSPTAEWRWTPDPHGRASRPVVLLGALLIMAASCLTAGFVIGRITAGPKIGHVAAQVANSPIAAPATSSVPFKKPPERDTVLAPGGAAPSVVILNPGTADAAKQEEPDLVPDARIRDASRRRSDVRNSATPVQRAPPNRTGGVNAYGQETRPTPERDYRALRDYALGR
jgi:hypothetical protein